MRSNMGASARGDGERPSAAASRLVRFSRPLILAPIVAVLFASVVQPRINTWGATAAERNAVWPGDSLSDARYTWTNGITIDAPADAVWPWVTQLGQGRAGLYSYDWLENALFAGVHSESRIVPEYQQALDVGDEVIRMARYAPHNPVALYLPGRALVLGHVDDTADELRSGRATTTWAFIVEPVDASRSRLIVRSRVDSVAARLQGPAQFVMQRKLMTGIKERAEGTWHPSAGDVVEPLIWFAAGGAVLAAAWFATRPRRDWWRPIAAAAGGVVALGYLMFWAPPLPLAVVVAAVPVAAVVADRVAGRHRAPETGTGRAPRARFTHGPSPA